MRKTVNQAITNKNVLGLIGEQIKRYGGAGVILKIKDGETTDGAPGQVANIKFIGNVFRAEITLATSFYKNTSKEHLISDSDNNL